MATQQRGRKPGRTGKGDRTQATIRFPVPLYSDLKLGAGEAGWPEFSDYIVALCAAARAADIKPIRAVVTRRQRHRDLPEAVTCDS